MNKTKTKTKAKVGTKKTKPKVKVANRYIRIQLDYVLDLGRQFIVVEPHEIAVLKTDLDSFILNGLLFDKGLRARYDLNFINLISPSIKLTATPCNWRGPRLASSPRLNHE
jgi:hypothetical protein